MVLVPAMATTPPPLKGGEGDLIVGLIVIAIFFLLILAGAVWIWRND